MAITITKPVVVVVEGPEDKAFFEGLAKHLNIDNVQVEAVEGVDKISLELELLAKNSDFRSKAVSLAVVRDADKNPTKAFDDVIEALQSAGFSEMPPEPLISTNDSPRITIMIMPGDNQPGSLETLCLAAFKDDSVMPCVEQHFVCLKETGLKLKDRVLPKAKVRVLLASKSADEFQKGDPIWGISLAFKKDWWPWDDPVFDGVKSFLKQVASGIET